MSWEPERIVEVFAVRALDPIRKKWYTTRWKMTREDAAKYFADTQYEIQESTKEQRTYGRDPSRLCAGHLYEPFKGR
ncbi:MAG TPA: hypothetical protein VJ577_20145 [Burkholderiaceae bacterium]|nr:hypothetical protein [Burkholderiaceae bacterium]